MFLFLFLLFTVVPALEIYFLIQVGQSFGIATTFFLVVLTGVIGAGLTRSQGRQIFGRLQGELQSGHLPANELIGAVLVFVAGILMITPGFMTDAFGLLLVIPFTRYLIVRGARSWFQRQMKQGRVVFYGGRSQAGGSPFGRQEHPFQSQVFTDWQESSQPTIRDVTPKPKDSPGKIESLNSSDS